MYKHMLSAVALTALFRTAAPAQTTLNAAGGSAVIGGNTYEYSIGEMTVISTNTAGSITVTHGVLQPAKSGGTGISNQPWLSSSLAVYPNPAQDELFIRPSLPAASLLTLSLMDVTGKLVFVGPQATLYNGTEQQRINLAGLAAGAYLLVVEATQSNGSRASEAFKINKVR